MPLYFNCLLNLKTLLKLFKTTLQAHDLKIIVIITKLLCMLETEKFYLYICKYDYIRGTLL